MPHNHGHDRIISWLKDAHAMEKSLETVLEKQAKHADSDPAMRDRLTRHAEETRRHAQLVEQALERLGTSKSTLKDMTGGMQARMHGMLTGGSGDTLVKDTLSGIAAEHFEIACYTSLQTAALDVGDQATAQMCEQILRDEHAMAEYLEQELPRITHMELAAATA